LQNYEPKGLSFEGEIFDKAMKQMFYYFATTVQWSFSEMMIRWNWVSILITSNVKNTGLHACSTVIKRYEVPRD
jgi:hypothetical protein